MCVELEGDVETDVDGDAEADAEEEIESGFGAAALVNGMVRPPPGAGMAPHQGRCQGT